MQQTKLDRWLKEKFIYETHIFTIRLPDEKLPRGVKVRKLEKGEVGSYNYRLIVKSSKKSDRFIAFLKENHLMHATRIVEGKHIYNHFVAPQGKSFTYLWIFRFFFCIAFLSFAWFVYILLQDDSLMTTLKESWKELKGGE